jgi:hypothetical protein
VERALLALVLVALAVVVAVLLQRRRPSASAHPAFAVPDGVDRNDFDRPGAPWLVAVFTARTCDSCAGVVEKARALESEAVAVQEIEVSEKHHLHVRYAVDAVPLTIIVDAVGGVRRHFFGPVPTADLWAAVADARDPDAGTP